MANRKKYVDRNGFLHLEGNPISRVQVAPYLGKQIDPKGEFAKQGIKLSPNEVYGVYRSPDELFDEDVMHQFDGMPFRVGHQMLGKGNGKVKPVDAAPADGCIMNVRRGTDEDEVKHGDPKDFLFADIVIYSEKALKAISDGTTELSIGYRCSYTPKKGVHDGIPYDFIQSNITANHLALVPRGRAGSSVCVMDEAIVSDDGLVITCDSLPEEIQIMDDNEKKAKDKLVGLLNGTEEQIQDCLDYCDLTKEQKDAIKAIKAKGDEAETPAEDKACKGSAKDEDVPPPPPPAEKKDDPGEGDGKEEAAPAEGADPVPAPVSGEEVEKPAEKPADAPSPAPAEPPAPAEVPAKDCGDGCGCKGKKKEAKTFTQDELDEACAKARKEGRAEALRAKALADAIGEDAADKTEAEVARDYCKKTKELNFAQDASDDVVLGVVRGHLAAKKDDDEEGKAKAAKPKKLLTVAQDEAIAKAPHFTADKLVKYLGA